MLEEQEFKGTLNPVGRWRYPEGDAIEYAPLMMPRTALNAANPFEATDQYSANTVE